MWRSPAYAENAYRIELFGDQVEGIQHFDPLTGEVFDEIDQSPSGRRPTT